MYVLYGGPFTRALVTEMVLAEGDLPHEVRDVDILSGGHRTPEFLKINPAGWVPALITPEGEHLYETPAINLYLAERHALTHLAPATADKDRGRFLSGFFFLAGDLEPVMKRVFYAHRFVVRPEDENQAKQMAMDTALERLSVIERQMSESGGPYVLGERFSLIDLTLAYWLGTLDTSGMHDQFPAILKMADLVRARPKLSAHFVRLDEDKVKYADLQRRGEGVK
ncbi:MAG: glutathione S-transferase family protein [Pseudomonadota bacterium]